MDEYLVRESLQRQAAPLGCDRSFSWAGECRSSVTNVEAGLTRSGPQGAVGRWRTLLVRDSSLDAAKRSSEDAVGNDADRIEFRYRDANNRIDLKCSRTSVPGTWLTVYHISGPTLINTIKSVRENRARVEGPEQTEQFAQLAAIHQDWWKASWAKDEDQIGSYVTFVEGLDEGNFHVIARSKLMVREGQVVPTRALAEMQHVGGVTAPTGPPSLTAGAWLDSSEQAYPRRSR